MMTTYGISHTDTINSYWYVINAINKHPQFNITCPADHDAQYAIIQDFTKVSKAGFKYCPGAIDGILIWIRKPSKKDCTAIGCDGSKFFCGRKKSSALIVRQCVMSGDEFLTFRFCTPVPLLIVLPSRVCPCFVT